jgi:hypothetical protein
MRSVLPTAAGNAARACLTTSGTYEKIHNKVENRANCPKRVRKTISLTCPICGDSYERPLCEVKRSGGEPSRMFCSLKCSAHSRNRLEREGKIALHVPPWLQKSYATTYRKARYGAKRRGVEFFLSKEEFNTIVERSGNRCEVSGLAFSSNSEGIKYARRARMPSLDRIDSEGPYSFANCRIVAVVANFAMNSWGEGMLVHLSRNVQAKQMNVSPERYDELMQIAQRILQSEDAARKTLS